MRRTLPAAAVIGALALLPAAAIAQEARQAPASRAAQRSSPSPRSSGGGGERAVPRSAPAPTASRPAQQSRPSSPRSSASSGRSSGGDQSRQRTAPPRQRSSGGGERAVQRSGVSGAREADRSQPAATARDRGGRQSFGTAVARRHPPGRPGHGGGHYYYPRWSYPYYPLTYGFLWDPWWGYGYPFGYGYGYGSGWYGGYGYGGGYGAYAGPQYEYYGSLRLKVKPREAEVFVDGYFAGVVDDFDGAFQKLNLDVGPHKIEVRHPGYEALSFEIRTQPDEKITYKGDLKPVP